MIRFTKDEKKVILFLAFSLLIGCSLSLVRKVAPSWVEWIGVGIPQSELKYNFSVEDSTEIDKILQRSKELRDESNLEFDLTEISPIDINEAAMNELTRLPGIGPSTARKIVTYREEKGNFRSIDELVKVPGLGEKKVEKIEPFLLPIEYHGQKVEADIGKPSRLIDINEASQNELTELPGIGPSTAQEIISYREEHGKFSSIGNLTKVPGLGEKKVEKIKPFLIPIEFQDEKVEADITKIPQLIDINEASVDELTLLPGIGLSTAKKIISFREENGDFQRVDDLVKVPGLGEKKVEEIKPLLIPLESQREGVGFGVEVITSESSEGKPALLIDINSATQSELEKLPGIGPTYSQRIIEYRTKNGPFSSLDELLKVKGIGKTLLEKIRPHIISSREQD